MEMTRIFFATLFLFHLILVPSSKANALPFQTLFNPFGAGAPGLENQHEDQHAFQYEQGQAAEQQPQQENGVRQQQQQPQENGAKQQQQQQQPTITQPVTNNVTGLQEGFYSVSCPNAEQIVAKAVADIFKKNPGSIANIVRLQFHDCFVGGCDASILLDSIPTGENVEKSSLFNGQLLKGTDLIDDIKAKLEQECPLTVSCADTLAFASQAAMSLAGSPQPRPLGGRRDATLSLAALAEANNLPLPNWSLDQMLELFKRKGFNEEEMVILLGAHSIGSAHCDVFSDRLYNFQKTQKPDPALPLPVIDELKLVCKVPGTPQFRNPPVNFDETPTKLDNLFFRDLVEKKKALLATDSALINDARTAPFVQKMATDPDYFSKRFAEVVSRMSTVDVKTGINGEVRKTCRSTN